jgi:hypothetical protein
VCLAATDLQFPQVLRALLGSRVAGSQWLSHKLPRLRRGPVFGAAGRLSVQESVPGISAPRAEGIRWKDFHSSSWVTISSKGMIRAMKPLAKRSRKSPPGCVRRIWYESDDSGAQEIRGKSE